MIPHNGAGGCKFDASNKEEFWAALLDEREASIDCQDGFDKPVLVKTGSLVNSFAIEQTKFGRFVADLTTTSIRSPTLTK